MLSIFKRITVFTCCAIILIVLGACSNNQPEDSPDVYVPTVADVAEPEDVITEQQPEDVPDDEPLENETTTEVVDVEEATYSSELATLREDVVGLWNVYSSFGYDWLVRGESIEFFADGTGLILHGDGWITDITWTVDEIEHLYQEFLLIMTYVEFDYQVSRFLVKLDGQLRMYEDAGPPTIFSRNELQPATIASNFDADLIGMWQYHQSDGGFWTIEFHADGTGFSLPCYFGSEFTWWLENGELMTRYDTDYGAVLLIYDFEIVGDELFLQEVGPFDPIVLVRVVFG